MEVLALLIIWPFLLLVIGLAFISLNLLNSAFWVVAIIFLLFLYAAKDRIGTVPSTDAPQTDFERLENTRRVVLIFTISILLPVFTRYFIAAWNDALPGILFGLSLGFTTLLWGIFAKNNRVLIYGNLIGSILTLAYVYFRIWELGDLARIIATAFGLGVAVVVSVLKLKERLK